MSVSEANKRARNKHDAKAFVYQTVKFKKSEKDALDEYCRNNQGIVKNALMRKAIMDAIGYEGEN